MHTGERWRLGHRPALDGLRGVAVLLVVACHSGVPGMAGAGNAGVTVFFVLSGFLITALLLEEGDRTGRISIRAFYLRRAARLLPALLALVGVCAVVVAAGFAVTTPQAIVGSLLYVNNWLFVAAPGAGGWLVHTWSLAIEEQFYAVAPLVVILLRRRPTLLLALCGLGAFAAVALRVGMWAQGVDFYRIYLGTDTRIDGLLVGMGLAVLVRRGVVSSGRVAAGLGMLTLAAFIIPTGRTELVAVWAPAAVAAGTVPLLLSAIDSPGGLLGSRWLRWVGRRSYAIYLWHLPMTHLAFDLGLPRPMQVLFVALTTATLAEASWRFVERPFQRRSVRPVEAAGLAGDAGRVDPSRSGAEGVATAR